MIKRCTCSHISQDKLHGKNNRVFNKTKSSPGVQDTYRCTVCKRETT